MRLSPMADDANATPNPRAIARSYTIPPEVDEALRAEADRRGVSRTMIVVEALRAYLESSTPRAAHGR